MKTREQRTADANWLRDARKARGFTSAEAGRLAVNKATGATISKSVYAQYESGSRAIAEHHRPALVSYWGEPPESTQPAQSISPDTLAIVAAIDRLTFALASRPDLDDVVVRSVAAALRAAGVPSRS